MTNDKWPMSWKRLSKKAWETYYLEETRYCFSGKGIEMDAELIDRAEAIQQRILHLRDSL